MKMKPTGWRIFSEPLAVAIGLVILADGASAQHYPAGVEGIKGASLPPPGVYLRDYNYFYFADEFPGGPAGFDAFVYVDAPRLVWMTGWKILGADYGMDVVVPFGYANIKVTGTKDNRFGLGDIEMKPVILSWHVKQFDFSTAYGFWSPSGDFNPNRLANLGKGFWTHMLEASVTWYPDADKNWAVSLLNWYEINQKQANTGVTLGQTLTSEWGISKTVAKGVDVGLVGYAQQQTTANTGPGTSGSLSHVFAIGPEICGMIPKINVITSVRYLREFGAKDHSEGNTVTLTLTKRF